MVVFSLFICLESGFFIVLFGYCLLLCFLLRMVHNLAVLSDQYKKKERKSKLSVCIN